MEEMCKNCMYFDKPGTKAFCSYYGYKALEAAECANADKPYFLISIIHADFIIPKTAQDLRCGSWKEATKNAQL